MEKLTINRLHIGGGFLQAFFDVRGLNTEGAPESQVERVLGKDEDELRKRLKVRFPNRRVTLRKVWV
jgi:hypothetical protein